MAISKPTIQSLLLTMRFEETVLATGTGIVVNNSFGPLLLTNRHNFTGLHQETGKPLHSQGGLPNEITITHNAKGYVGLWQNRTETLYDKNGVPRWVEHPSLGARADIVALPLTSLDNVELHPYDLDNVGPPIDVIPAETVSVVGFPLNIRHSGSFAIWATGFVASEPDIDYDGLPVFLIDCRSRTGQSGSAVIAQRNAGLVRLQDKSLAAFNGPVSRFMGLYSGRVSRDSDLGMVWKVSALRELIAAVE